MIQVAITDDHPLVLAGLKDMLKSFNDIQITGLYSSGAALLEGLEHEQPDILLLDIQLPDKKGWELAAIISNQYPMVKILAITSFDATGYVKSMMRSGCKGYLLKNTDQQTLVKAIRMVYDGEEYIEPAIKEQMLQNIMHFKKASRNELPVLTRREKEILKLIIEEHTSQQIADKLCLSLRTIENHRFNIQQKLQVKNTVGLIKIAIEMGLYTN